MKYKLQYFDPFRIITFKKNGKTSIVSKLNVFSNYMLLIYNHLPFYTEYYAEKMSINDQCRLSIIYSSLCLF